MNKAMLQGHILDQYEYVVGSGKGPTFTYTCLCMFIVQRKFSCDFLYK
jgi:hypothetical protein